MALLGCREDAAYDALLGAAPPNFKRQCQHHAVEKKWYRPRVFFRMFNTGL
jgi:hypothetical protein